MKLNLGCGDKPLEWRNLPQPLLDAWALVGGRQGRAKPKRTVKTKRHNPEMIHVVKARTPEPVWSWLMVELDTPYSNRECVELLPDDELAVEYHERMRNY